ncbi:CPBP family intramembrane glutamic endopeptidase [Roseomonas sp. AR75]|uniref:CPBP family intramembrane glutamic endopeptidase n=1 Tax=Roseomonas sp. AR75 TaxID=2562311 RepID=UPI0010C131C9|nr:CPBP family intramembrane glutamic endopeptidase [Roseomonas sp. AR75]
MTATTQRMPAFGRRILTMPLIRLVVLGAALFVMLVMSNDVMLALSGRPLAAAAGVVGMAAAAVAVYVGFARLVERRGVAELSLPGMGRELGLGIAIGAGLYAACVLVLVILGIYRIEGLNPWTFLLPALAMALSSGIFEELLFRGVIYRSVEDVCGSWVALVVSSLVFGFVHLLNPAGTVMGALFISIEAGLLLAAAYMLTRRLWLSIGFHMSWNYTQSAIFSGIVSGGDTDPGLIRATIEGPAALTGGSFGLESSLVALVFCTATGLVLLALAIRRGRVRPPAWRRTA